MKMVDIDYHVTLYNTANGVSDDIAKLNHPQRYVRLVTPVGEVFNLDIVDVYEDEIVLCLADKVK